MMHWATSYVGKPYSLGARGPDAYDCWGLLVDIYQTQFNITLPTLPGISAQSASTIHKHIVGCIGEDWISVEKPFDGCAVAMSQQKVFHHVGVYITANGGKILHCWEKQNVIVDNLIRLRFKGLKKIAYFKHRLWPT